MTDGLEQNLEDDGNVFDDLALDYQPWLNRSQEVVDEQEAYKIVLSAKANATIGTECYISKNAGVFTNRLEVGDGSWIAHGAIVRGIVKIGKNTSINPYAHIAGHVTIGSNVRIAGMASIYGMNHGFSRVDLPVSQQPHTSKGVIIGDGVWIGANAVIVDGCAIGEHCVVGAGAVVTKSFPAFQVLAGNPARVIRDRRAHDNITKAEVEDSPVDGSPATDMRPTSTIAQPDASSPPEKMLAHIADQLPALSIRSLLFTKSPYHDLKTRYPADLQGWGSTHSIFRTSIEALKPNLIVEIGSWKGASAIHMALICRELRLKTEIVCVDTWLGNWQHWSRDSGVGSRVDLKLGNGFPHLYYQFLSNVLAQDVDDLITPLPLTGIGGAKLFAHYGCRPDLIYLDGDHEYESVIMDLRSWLPLISPNGFLIGDDYDWPGVRRAVQEIVEEQHWQVTLVDNKFRLSRVEKPYTADVSLNCYP